MGDKEDKFRDLRLFDAFLNQIFFFLFISQPNIKSIFKIRSINVLYQK